MSRPCLCCPLAYDLKKSQARSTWRRQWLSAVIKTVHISAIVMSSVTQSSWHENPCWSCHFTSGTLATWLKHPFNSADFSVSFHGMSKLSHAEGNFRRGGPPNCKQPLGCVRNWSCNHLKSGSSQITSCRIPHKIPIKWNIIMHKQIRSMPYSNCKLQS